MSRELFPSLNSPPVPYARGTERFGMAYSSSKIKLHFLLRAINLSLAPFHEGSHLRHPRIRYFPEMLQQPNSILSDDQSRIIRIQLDVLKERKGMPV